MRDVFCTRLDALLFSETVPWSATVCGLLVFDTSIQDSRSNQATHCHVKSSFLATGNHYQGHTYSWLDFTVAVALEIPF